MKMTKKKDNWTLFCAGIGAPFISFALSAMISAFHDILIAL
jgi:hypothetical protein